MASSTPRHDHKNYDEKRTCATQFKRPIETSRLKLSQRSSQRHWPLPAPFGYMCRFTPSKVSGTGTGSSSTMAACFQASSCSLSSCGISRLQGLCCPSRKYTLSTRVSTPRPTISGALFVSIGILAFSLGSSRGACYLSRAQAGRVAVGKRRSGEPRRRRWRVPTATRLARRKAVQVPPSVHLSREDAMPERAGIQVIGEQQEIKDVAAECSGVAVPAGRASRAGRVDAKGGVSVPPIVVVPAGGAEAHAVVIQLDVAADQGERVLHRTPLMNGHRRRGGKCDTWTGIANDVCVAAEVVRWSGCGRWSGRSSQQDRSRHRDPLAYGKPFDHLVDGRSHFHQRASHPLHARPATARQEMHPERQADERAVAVALVLLGIELDT